MRIGVAVAEPAGPPALTKLRDKLQALTVAAAGGRLTLGIGLSHKIVIEDGALAQAVVTDFVALEFGSGDEAVRTRTLLASLVR